MKNGRITVSIILASVLLFLAGCSNNKENASTLNTETLPVHSESDVSTADEKTTAPETQENSSAAVGSTETEEMTEAPGTVSTTEEIVSTEAETEEPTLPVSSETAEQTTPAATQPAPIQPTAPPQTTPAVTQPAPETEPETTAEVPVVERAFHMVLCRANDKVIEQRGLSSELKAAGSSPVFRLDSLDDVRQFCSIFADDDDLQSGIAPYDQAFFSSHVLFVINDPGGSSSSKEADYRVEKLLQNSVLHFRINQIKTDGWGTADIRRLWFFVPVERSVADQLIAYDASWASVPLPPDWTEPVNPDWRKME